MRTREKIRCSSTKKMNIFHNESFEEERKTVRLRIYRRKNTSLTTLYKCNAKRGEKTARNEKMIIEKTFVRKKQQQQQQQQSLDHR